MMESLVWFSPVLLKLLNCFITEIDHLEGNLSLEHDNFLFFLVRNTGKDFMQIDTHTWPFTINLWFSNSPSWWLFHHHTLFALDMHLFNGEFLFLYYRFGSFDIFFINIGNHTESHKSFDINIQDQLCHSYGHNADILTSSHTKIQKWSNFLNLFGLFLSSKHF